MDGGVGFYERAKNDAQLKTILGTKTEGGFARVEGGWPEDFTHEEAFPLVTYIVAVDGVVRPGIRDFELQIDIWVWVDGAAGGPAKIEAADERLLALFDEQSWTQGGVRWNAIMLPAGEFPAGPGQVIRKRRGLQLRGVLQA